jgi:hypothetical protein
MGLPRLIGKALNTRTIYLLRPDSMAGLVLWIPSRRRKGVRDYRLSRERQFQEFSDKLRFDFSVLCKKLRGIFYFLNGKVLLIFHWRFSSCPRIANESIVTSISNARPDNSFFMIVMTSGKIPFPIVTWGMIESGSYIFAQSNFSVQLQIASKTAPCNFINSGFLLTET